MIVVKLELWPRGDESHAKEIGRMYIANDGKGTTDRGDYQVAVCRRNTTDVPAPIDPGGSKATRTGTVTRYPRLAYNVWRLIARALLSAFPEEERGGKARKILDESSVLIDDDAQGMHANPDTDAAE